jgi:hypothetical protein
MSVRDLERKIPWARKRWKRIQRENTAYRDRVSSLFNKASAKRTLFLPKFRLNRNVSSGKD